MKYPKKTRRQFLSDSYDVCMQMMLASLSLKMGLGSRLARASTPPGKLRRHLINIAGFGGWDSYHFHQGMTSADYLSIDPSAGSTVAGQTWLQALSAYALRYTDSQATILPSGQSIGQGLTVLLKNLTSANTVDPVFNVGLSDLLIWRGMTSTSAHGISNHMIMEGQLSSYASSYSSIVALALASSPDYVRTLHYVQLSSNPAGMDMQTGFLNGYAIPVNIPNSASWTNMTSAEASAPAGSVAALQEAAISALGGIAANKSYALAQSQQIYAGFSGSFSSFLTVASSNWANSPQFKAIVSRYTQVLSQQMAPLMTLLYTPGPSGQTPGLTALQSLSTKNPTSSTNMLGNALGMQFGATATQATATFVNGMAGTIFAYALAEFLIKNDLSAVVDIPTPMSDCHTSLLAGLPNFLGSYICYLELVNALKNTDAGMGDGSSVLDHTTMIMQTDFDREPHPSYPGATSPVATPGNGHGYSTSAVMAGYGINKGTIVGDIMTGRYNSQFPGMSYFQPLPINSSGQPTPGGTTYDPQSILPTICAIFGATLPAEQITTAGVVQAILKAS